MSDTRNGTSYVVCLSNEGYTASLIVRRIYSAVPDSDASARGLMRVVDESGEDYLYPATMFARIELPAEIEKRLSSTSA